MQIKVAITKISVFAYTDKSNGARLMKMISIRYPVPAWIYILLLGSTEI